jgi:hypothetical protein
MSETKKVDETENEKEPEGTISRECWSPKEGGVTYKSNVPLSRLQRACIVVDALARFLKDETGHINAGEQIVDGNIL